MEVDSVIKEALEARVSEVDLSCYKYDKMLDLIEKEGDIRKKRGFTKLKFRGGKFFTTIRIKDVLEVAIVILVLITVPLIANLNKMPRPERVASTKKVKTITITEAEALIRGLINDRIYMTKVAGVASPTLSDDSAITLVELTTDEILQRMGMQLYQIQAIEEAGKIYQYAIFAIKKREVREIASSSLAGEVRDLCMADLDRNGVPELILVHSGILSPVSYTSLTGNNVKSYISVIVLDKKGNFVRGTSYANYDIQIYLDKVDDYNINIRAGNYFKGHRGEIVGKLSLQRGDLDTLRIKYFDDMESR